MDGRLNRRNKAAFSNFNLFGAVLNWLMGRIFSELILHNVAYQCHFRPEYVLNSLYKNMLRSAGECGNQPVDIFGKETKR